MTTTTEDNVELSDYLVMIRKNWLVALIIFLVIMGAAVLYTLTAPKIYQARSLVMLTSQDQTSVLLGSSSVATLPRIDIETEKEIIMSSSVLSQVYAVPEQADFSISVDAIQDSSVIEIIVESENPQTAMRVANRIAAAYVNYTRESRRRDALDINSFISEQIAVYKAEIDDLNLQIIVYKNKNMTVQDQFAFESLQQTLDAKEKLYNYLLSRAEEIGIAAQEKSGNVKIIENAQPPRIPVRPNVALNLVLGFILAIIISAGFIFIKESMKNTFKSLKDIEDEMGASIIGVVPRIGRREYIAFEKKPYFADKVFNFAKSPVAHVKKIFTSRKTGRQEYFVVDSKSEGPFAESIRLLKTNLLVCIKEKNIKIISVNSAQKNDGKTTIAVNLALEIAHDGKKVLLADANLRNPVLNEIFKVESEEGLSDIILGNSKLEKAIVRTSVKNLSLLPGGKHNHVPGELISTEKIKDIFAKLRSSDFDVIIFDNTSLRYSESLSIAANSQGMLFILAHDKSNKDWALKSKETLHKVKVHIIGVVVNFFK